MMQVDRERTGSLSPDAIHAFLADLGLRPTDFDVRHIMAELDVDNTGGISRDNFVEFIRHGGRMPGKASLHSRVWSWFGLCHCGDTIMIMPPSCSGRSAVGR